MKRILITGAGGFIGNALMQFYKSGGNFVEGWDVVRNSDNMKVVDLLQMEQVLKALADFHPDVIFHCAGSASVPFSIENPREDYERNVTITHMLLFGMKQLQLTNTRFIYMSSAGVYGQPKHLPINEESAVAPLSPYALHKVMAEDICKYFHQDLNFDVKIVRIFSAYGVGLKKQIFWDMNQKCERTGKLELFGTGSETRDYIYIDDLIQSLNLIMNKSPKEELIYNIANGEETSINTIAEIFTRLKGIDSGVSFNGVVREGDPLNWKADISKLKKLGYEKGVPIETGIKKYVEWISEIQS